MAATGLHLSVTGSDNLADLIGFVQDGVGWRKFDRARERFRKKVERRALRVLGAVPPPRRRGFGVFRWSYHQEAQIRAARWFFKHYPNGYVRTGQLARGWRVGMSITRAGFAIDIRNDAPHADRVYQTDSNRQIPAHQDWGWPDTRDLFLDISASAETMLSQELDLFIQQELR